MPPRPSPERVIAAAGPAGAYPVRVPLVQAAAAQLGAFLLVLALTALVPAAAPAQGEAMAWAWVQGIVAARLGRGLGMDSWWLPLHALFVPGLVWMLALGLPPLYFLGAFCALASVYWGVSGTRVPLFLSSRAAARALADLLPPERSFTFVDLGSGLGGVISSLARARPAGRYYGIEAAPLPFLLSRLRAVLGMRGCELSWGDFQDLDLGRYDVVYAYLSPAAMPGLWDKARREMRAGSLLISNSFAVPGVPPTSTVATGAQGGSRLLLWRM
jgi:hypothetical protein